MKTRSQRNDLMEYHRERMSPRNSRKYWAICAMRKVRTILLRVWLCPGKPLVVHKGDPDAHAIQSVLGFVGAEVALQEPLISRAKASILLNAEKSLANITLIGKRMSFV